MLYAHYINLIKELRKSYSKKICFQLYLKIFKVGLERISAGSLFHRFGAASMKERSARAFFDLMRE